MEHPRKFLGLTAHEWVVWGAVQLVGGIALAIPRDDDAAYCMFYALIGALVMIVATPGMLVDGKVRGDRNRRR